MYTRQLGESRLKIIDGISPKQKPVTLFKFRQEAVRVLISLEVNHPNRIDNIAIARKAYKDITFNIISYCQQHPSGLDCDFDKVYETIGRIQLHFEESGKYLFSKT